MPSVDYKVLRRPRLRGGIGGNVAVLLWAGTGLIGLFIGLPWGLLVIIPALIIQGSLLWAFRADPKILEVYGLYATLPDEFRAGIPLAYSMKLSRPEKFAKGVAQ